MTLNVDLPANDSWNADFRLANALGPGISEGRARESLKWSERLGTRKLAPPRWGGGSGRAAFCVAHALGP